MFDAMRIRYTSPIALIALIGACSASSGVEVTSLEAPVELELRVGEERRVGGSAARVEFRAVLEDSRCPQDVVCVWAGNAAIEIGLTDDAEATHAIALNTGIEPRATEWNELRVTLLSVTPVPREGETIPAREYVVRLRFEPIGDGRSSDAGG